MKTWYLLLPATNQLDLTIGLPSHLCFRNDHLLHHGWRSKTGQNEYRMVLFGEMQWGMGVLEFVVLDVLIRRLTQGHAKISLNDEMSLLQFCTLLCRDCITFPITDISFMNEITPGASFHKLI